MPQQPMPTIGVIKQFFETLCCLNKKELPCHKWIFLGACSVEKLRWLTVLLGIGVDLANNLKIGSALGAFLYWFIVRVVKLEDNNKPVTSNLLSTWLSILGFISTIGFAGLHFLSSGTSMKQGIDLDCSDSYTSLDCIGDAALYLSFTASCGLFWYVTYHPRDVHQPQKLCAYTLKHPRLILGNILSLTPTFAMDYFYLIGLYDRVKLPPEANAAFIFNIITCILTTINSFPIETSSPPASPFSCSIRSNIFWERGTFLLFFGSLMQTISFLEAFKERIPQYNDWRLQIVLFGIAPLFALSQMIELGFRYPKNPIDKKVGKDVEKGYYLEDDNLSVNSDCLTEKEMPPPASSLPHDADTPDRPKSPVRTTVPSVLGVILFEDDKAEAEPLLATDAGLQP